MGFLKLFRKSTLSNMQDIIARSSLFFRALVKTILNNQGYLVKLCMR